MKDTDSNTMESSFASGDFAELPERPTKVRYGVLAFLAAMTFILYLDRVCIGQSATAIKRDLGISDVWMSWVFNAFIISYTTLEIPTGRWGDRYGSRSVLARVVVWWSCFTALTGAAASLTMLLIVRFLFGAGEAGALPNAARVLKEWFPESSRGRAQGMITTAMMIGGAVSPPGRAEADQRVRLALDVRGFRSLGAGLGDRLLSLVPRRSGRAPGNQPGRAITHQSRWRPDPQVGGRVISRPTSRFPGRPCFATRISGS